MDLPLFAGSLLLLAWPLVILGLFRWKDPGVRDRPALSDEERRRVHRRCAEQ